MTVDKDLADRRRKARFEDSSIGSIGILPADRSQTSLHKLAVEDEKQELAKYLVRRRYKT